MKNITGEEIAKIKMMCEYGMKVPDIAKVTGRSRQSIYRIKSGTHEAYKVSLRNEERRKRSAQKETPKSDPTPQKPEKEEKGSYTEILLNAILMKLTQLCDELGIGDKTADKSGLTA